MVQEKICWEKIESLYIHLLPEFKATRRNEWVAKHAVKIVVAHTSHGGNLSRQVKSWESADYKINYLI
jgi:hypothetical protein